jgi:hypothetical protein
MRMYTKRNLGVPSNTKEYSRLYMKQKRAEKSDAPYQRDYRKRVRAEVIKHYGDKCECCEETELLFLTIDHINGDGAEHRRQNSYNGDGRSGWSIYYWLRKNNYPEGFRVLCWNCNCSRQHNSGVCPHKGA